MSALFTITPGGKVLRDVFRAVQRHDPLGGGGLAYEQVQAVFDEVDRESGIKGQAAERSLPVPATSTRRCAATC